MGLSFFEIFFIALGLSMDSFAVALCAGTSSQSGGRRAVLRLAFYFGLFQGSMPILGWAIGSMIEPFIAPFDHWVAFFLLLIVAIRMFRDGGALQRNPNSEDLTRGATLMMLSIATSIDALAIGLGLAILGVAIWTPSLIIGLITSLVAVAGMMLGSKIGDKYGRRVQILGGVVLIFIGIRIVISHMFG